MVPGLPLVGGASSGRLAGFAGGRVVTRCGLVLGIIFVRVLVGVLVLGILVVLRVLALVVRSLLTASGSESVAWSTVGLGDGAGSAVGVGSGDGDSDGAGSVGAVVLESCGISVSAQAPVVVSAKSNCDDAAAPTARRRATARDAVMWEVCGLRASGQNRSGVGTHKYRNSAMP